MRLQAYCLAGLACIAAQNDDATTAGRLWTLAERIEQQIGFRMLAAERGRYERILAPALARRRYRAGVASAAEPDPLTAVADSSAAEYGHVGPAWVVLRIRAARRGIASVAAPTPAQLPPSPSLSFWPLSMVSVAAVSIGEFSWCRFAAVNTATSTGGGAL